MRALAIIMIAIVVLAAVFELDHYEWFQRPRDESNIRQQFHLPADDAAFLHFESYPKSLIPEGLRINAVVQLSEAAFETYLAKLVDAQTWKPVALVGYSPDIGASYSPQALKWNDLPLPVQLAATLKRMGGSAPQASTIKTGKYFCSILQMVKSGASSNNPNAYIRNDWTLLRRTGARRLARCTGPRHPGPRIAAPACHHQVQRLEPDPLREKRRSARSQVVFLQQASNERAVRAGRNQPTPKLPHEYLIDCR
ncbi:MAG: hypothetical protein R3D67_00205 [Hyphomicrobiaceae bacterium]